MNTITTSGPSSPRRFIVDLSDLYSFLSRRSGIAGIQRFLLNIAGHVPGHVASHRSAWTNDNAEEAPYEILFAHWNPILAGYFEFPIESGSADFRTLRDRLRLPRIDEFKRDKHPNAPITRGIYRARRTFRRILELKIRGAGTRSRLECLCRPLEFRAGDVLLSMGSIWDVHVQKALDHALPHIESGQVTPIFLVHDLIPFHPGIEIHTPEKVDRFKQAFRRSASLTDRFLVFSRATEVDLRRQLASLGQDAPRIARFRMPHEFICEPPDSNEAQAPLNRDDVPRNYVLMVGPIRGRKNGNRLWAAWRRLAEKHGESAMPDLVFAGSGRARDLDPPPSAEQKGRVRFVRFPSDAELARLYENARFCVFPSLCEGWGLPIGEALWHGKLCVTSAASSMPEVSGRFADYFDPRDVDSIAAALERPLFDADYLAERETLIENAPCLSWRETTKQLFDAANHLASL